MRIAALISESCLVKLEGVLWIGHSLVHARSADALRKFVSGGGCHLVVVDPTGLRDDVFKDTVDAVIASGIGLVIWAPLNPPAVDRILQASAVIPTTVLFQDVDDDADNLRAIVRAAGSATVTSMLLHRLVERIGRLPRDMRTKCAALFSASVIPTSAGAFAAGTQWSARGVERHFREVGLCTPGRFLKVLKVARAWELMRGRAHTLADVAGASGFRSGKRMAEQFILLAGAPPRRAVSQLTKESMVGQLLRASVRADPK